MNNENNHIDPLKKAVNDLPNAHADQSLWNKMAMRLDENRVALENQVAAYITALKTGQTDGLLLAENFRFKNPLGSDLETNVFRNLIKEQAMNLHFLNVETQLLGIDQACLLCHSKYHRGNELRHSEWIWLAQGKVVEIQSVYNASPYVNQMIG